MGYAQVTSVILIQFASITDCQLLSKSCADFINPRIFGVHSKLPLFLALLFYVLCIKLMYFIYLRTLEV